MDSSGLLYSINKARGWLTTRSLGPIPSKGVLVVSRDTSKTFNRNSYFKTEKIWALTQIKFRCPDTFAKVGRKMALILDRLIEASFTWPSLLSFQFSKLLSYLLYATNLFAGTFGNRQLAAHGILMQYASLAYMVRGSSKQSLKVFFFSVGKTHPEKFPIFCQNWRLLLLSQACSYYSKRILMPLTPPS